MVTYCCVINCPKGQWLKTANTEGRELRRGWAGCFWLGDGHKVAVKVLARAAVTRQCDRGWRCCFHCPQGCGLEALVSQTRGIPTTTAQKRTGSLCAHCVVSGFPQRKLPKREPGRICGAFLDAVSEATAFLSIMPYRSPRPAWSVREATAGGSLEAIRAAGYPSDFRFSFALGSAHLQEGKENDIYICDYKICTVNFS